MAITVSSKQKAHLLVLSRHEDGQFYWVFAFLGIRAAKKKAPFALIVSINAKGDGPSGETRTRGILVPNQAPYQLGHTRIAQTSLRNENIIHESPEKATPKNFGGYRFRNSGRQWNRYDTAAT